MPNDYVYLAMRKGVRTRVHLPTCTAEQKLCSYGYGYDVGDEQQWSTTCLTPGQQDELVARMKMITVTPVAEEPVVGPNLKYDGMSLRELYTLMYEVQVEITYREKEDD